MKKQILFVDDELFALDALRRMLRRQREIWDMTFLSCPRKALEHLRRETCDVLVADVRMPELDGLELLQHIRAIPRTKDLPVVMLTGLFDRRLKRKALELGATDLLNKPVELGDLLARLRNVLRLKSYEDDLKACNDLLEQQIEGRTEELFHSRLDIIWRLGKAGEFRDEQTGNHVIRVGCYSRAIAEVLNIDRHFMETIFLAAPLHDIGKIGIPDAILRKRGPLGPGQKKVMREHCAIGAEILRDDPKIRAAFLQWRGASSWSEGGHQQNPLLEMAASIALSHHEKWDGSGYPRQLAGQTIPVESRIVAVCDVYDAMTSRRPYKSPIPVEEAVDRIARGTGTHFDPQVQQAFVRALPDIRSIGEQFADGDLREPQLEETWDEEDLICR